MSSINLNSLKRNDPCYCTGDRKYKTCCLRKDEDFYRENLSRNVVVFHDMVFTEDDIDPMDFNDGRICASNRADCEAGHAIQQYFSCVQEFREGLSDKTVSEHLITLSRLIEQYPHNPVLYNLKHSAYLALGRNEEAAELLKETLEKFPRYFYAKLNMVQIHIANGEFKKIFDAFDRSHTLKQLMPHRTLFHVAEARTFHCYMSFYAIVVRDFRRAVFHREIFQKLSVLYGYDKDPDVLIMQFCEFFLKFFPALSLEDERDEAVMY